MKSIFVLGNQLKELLQSEARKKCTVDKFFCINRTIQLAPLQLSHQPQDEDAENIGHFHHRNDIPDTTHMVVKAPVGDVSVKDIFSKAREYVKTITANNQYLTEEDKKKDVDLNSNIVGVIGQAGIGKTTLTKTILNEIVDKKLFNCSYVFYLQLREVDYAEETNLLSFLAKTLSLPWINEPKRREAVVKELSTRYDVILIMDGFDEADIDDASLLISNTNLHQIAKAEVFIKNILRGTIFSNAKKIITSRPKQLLNLPSETRPKYILNILGIGLEAQYQICQSICGADAEHVFNYIQQHPPIATYCYVPCNCILVSHAVHKIKLIHAKNEKKCSMPHTITGILTVVLCLFVASPHVRNSKFDFPLKKLALLAWEGFTNKKFAYNKKDLLDAELTDEELNLFFVTTWAENSLSFVGGSKQVFYFAHLVIQEFFVALHLIYSMSLKKFKQIVTRKSFGPVQLSKPKIDLTEGKWEIVTKFLFGICNTKAHYMLQDRFSDLSEIVIEKTDVLRKFAVQKLQSFGADNLYFQKILPVCIWTHELNDDNFCSLIARNLKKKIVLQGKVLPSDIAPFNYVLLHRQATMKVDCTQYETWFADDSLTHFLNAVETSVYSFVKVFACKLFLVLSNKYLNKKFILAWLCQF